MPRTLSARLTIELKAVRKDLRGELKHVTDEDLDWAPAEGMKSYRALLTEIGAMQAETAIALLESRIPDWGESESRVTGETLEQLLMSLDGMLGLLLVWLESASDEDLMRSIEVPEDWVWMFGTRHVEHVELLRWIARHEYYHLGQIVTYNWIRGFDPYKPN